MSRATSHPGRTRGAPPPNGPLELWARARALRGRTLGELADALEQLVPEDPVRGKGFVGKLAELALGADPTAGERPDFVHLGIELKTVPITPARKPLQSTFVCSIAMGDASTAEWESSRLKQRLGTVLWLPYLPHACPRESRFEAPAWWVPTLGHWGSLRGDWEDLMGAIGAGQGHRLTARTGEVMQVRPKAAHSRVRVMGPAEDGLQSLLPLGFYLRARFVNALLNDPQTLLGPPKKLTM